MVSLLCLRILSRMGGDVAAADKLPHTWQYKIHQIADVDGVEAGEAGCLPVNREQKLAPTEGSEEEREKPEQHRKDDKLPAACFDPFHKVRPADPTEREIQQRRRKSDGDPVFKNIPDLRLHVTNLIKYSLTL